MLNLFIFGHYNFYRSSCRFRQSYVLFFFLGNYFRNLFLIFLFFFFLIFFEAKTDRVKTCQSPNQSKKKFRRTINNIFEKKSAKNLPNKISNGKTNEKMLCVTFCPNIKNYNSTSHHKSKHVVCVLEFLNSEFWVHVYTSHRFPRQNPKQVC